MATAPWRCSQCGTINEPVANSCRTCGKWPSLFDLEDSAVEGSAPEDVEVEGLGSRSPWRRTSLRPLLSRRAMPRSR